MNRRNAKFRWHLSEVSITELYRAIKQFHDKPKEWRDTHEYVIKQLRRQCILEHELRIQIVLDLKKEEQNGTV